MVWTPTCGKVSSSERRNRKIWVSSRSLTDRVVVELPQDLMTRSGHISVENRMKFPTPVPNVGGSLDNPVSQDFPHFIFDLTIRFALNREVLGGFFRVKVPLWIPLTDKAVNWCCRRDDGLRCGWLCRKSYPLIGRWLRGSWKADTFRHLFECLARDVETVDNEERDKPTKKHLQTSLIN